MSAQKSDGTDIRPVYLITAAPERKMRSELTKIGGCLIAVSVVMKAVAAVIDKVTRNNISPGFVIFAFDI